MASEGSSTSSSDEEDETRSFVLIRVGEHTDTEIGVYTGREPRQAALKVARRLKPASNRTLARRAPIEVELRERNTDKVHVFEAWAWKQDAPPNKPSWMDDTITAGNVEKKGRKVHGARENPAANQR